MKLILAILALLMATATVSLAQDYRLQPGDVVQIEVLEDPGLNRQTFVLPDGKISFPLAGTVQAGGRTLNQVQANLSTALAPNFAAPPTVYISVARLREREPVQPPVEIPEMLISVYVLGEIGNPGVRQIKPGTRLLPFLAQAGQFSRFAALKRLQLRRVNAHGQELKYLINLKAIQAGAELQSNFVMMEGDVLVVPQRRLFE